MTTEPLKALPVYLTEGTRKRLRIAAATHDTTMTAIAARAIERALDEMDAQEKEPGRTMSKTWFGDRA